MATKPYTLHVNKYKNNINSKIIYLEGWERGHTHLFSSFLVPFVVFLSSLLIPSLFVPERHVQDLFAEVLQMRLGFGKVREAKPSGTNYIRY